MRSIRAAATLAALTSLAFAQDRITLANGDVLTGTIKTMADGKVTITSPVLGDVTVPLTSIRDLTTQAEVDLRTVNGDTFHRRIAGMEAGRFKLDGDIPELAIDNLSKINPPAVEPPKWTGQMTIGGSLVTGNTERRAMGASFDASRRSETDRISFDAAWDYADDKTGGDWVLSQRRTGGGIKYDYFLTKRWYALGNARVLGDTLADLAMRFTGGAGLGYTMIENDMTTFVVEGGLSYLNENYISSTPPVDYVAARVAYRLAHTISEDTKLIHGVEAFPSLERAEDIYLQMKTEVVTKIAGDMIASLSWIMDYDNTPVSGNERTDHRVLLSVGWSF